VGATRRNDFGYAVVSEDVVAAAVAVARERYAGHPLVFVAGDVASWLRGALA